MLVYYLMLVPLLSVLSLGLYGIDKRRAIDNGNRIPERVLLVVDLFGGWPGGWWAQQKFRHKTQKISYRIKFFLAIGCNLVLLYLFASGRIG